MTRSIQKLLIANRGEIATRIARSAHARGISTVAVFSEADRHALHTEACDQAVFIGPSEASESYLNIPAILEAAARVGADAIHPGYGFLSENADFAHAVLDAGLVWVGPPPESIAVMGSKTSARDVVEKAGVPVVPGTHDLKKIPALGFPVLIKAVAGGGGRGMRVVENADSLDEALKSAAREAQSAFGNSALFAERYIQNGRHIEIQIAGDEAGRVVHLYERECSIQRRHQKVIEEAPSPILSAELREKMGTAAIQAAKSVGYTGVGTVEFLVSGEEFFFLEMNTRLQVEHAVTEAITNIDLVELQLAVAEGHPVDEPPPMDGAAIEVRLYAEDPCENYIPQTGTLLRFSLEEMDGIRIDTGVAEGSEVSMHYDPMMAKIIAHGRDREEARLRMIRSLERLCILGIKTNQSQLLAILRSEDFMSGNVHTGWLSSQSIDAVEPPNKAAIAALCHSLQHKRSILPNVAHGWRNSRFRPGRFQAGATELGWTPSTTGWKVQCGDKEHLVRYTASIDGGVLECDGVQELVQIAETERGYWVWFSEAASFLPKVPRFPEQDASVASGDCVASTPGKIIQIAVSLGQEVTIGDALLTLEAMKMEQTICAPLQGTVSQIHVEIGDNVSAGALLVEIEEES